MYTQLMIHKKSDTHFQFTCYDNEYVTDLVNVRNLLVRLMDDCSDALMRMSQKLICEQLNPTTPVHRVIVVAGGDEINQ